MCEVKPYSTSTSPYRRLFYNLSLTVETTRLNRRTECAVRRIKQSRTGGPPKQRRRPSDGRRDNTTVTVGIHAQSGVQVDQFLRETRATGRGGRGSVPDVVQQHVQAVLSSGSGQNTGHAHNVNRDAPCQQMPDGNIYRRRRNTEIYYPHTAIIIIIIIRFVKRHNVKRLPWRYRTETVVRTKPD